MPLALFRGNPIQNELNPGNTVETDHTPKPKTTAFSKQMKRLLLIGCFGCLVVFIGMAIIIVPDQVRSVSLPDLPQTLRDMRAQDKSDAPGPIDPLSLPADHGTSATPRQKIMEGVRPFLDLSSVPDDLRTSATLCNQAVDEVTSRLLTLHSNANGMDFEEFTTGTITLMHEYYGVVNTTAHSRLCDGDCATSHEALIREREERNIAWETLWYTISFEVANEKGDWDSALDSCIHLTAVYSDVWAEPGARDPARRDAAIYYARRDGLSARGALALCTLVNSPLRGPLVAIEKPLRPLERPVQNTAKAIDKLLWKPRDDQ